jgi:Short C-terminal domain
VLYPHRMPQPPDDVRTALNELANELAKAMEQGGRMVREAVKDVKGWAGTGAPPAPVPADDTPAATSASPLDAIRELGELRDAGLITEDEFQSKKTELLGRI